jgi:hypothetical protein
MAQPQSGKVSGESKGKTCADNARLRSRMALMSKQQRARAQAKTSGATSGNRVAEFIRAGAADADSSQADNVLERLTRPQAAAAEPVVATPAPAAPAVDLSKLESLTRHEAAAPATAAPEAAPAPAAAPVDLSKANDKLSGLLGGKKSS